MPFLHKFQEYDFQNGFQTHNSILDITPYEPEVIFIGSYNHGWSWNDSDFFYGRGMYMWPIMANLFLHQQNLQIQSRSFTNNIPSHTQLFEICRNGKFIFADIVKGLNERVIAFEDRTMECVVINNGEYTWKTYKDGPLDYMGAHGWLDDNVKAIVEYINNTPTIKHVYFTFKSGQWLVERINEISNGIINSISSCSIFTPTGNGFGQNLSEPFNERAWGLAHCWVWNGLEHDVPVNRIDYGHLDHNWLINKGVNPQNF